MFKMLLCAQRNVRIKCNTSVFPADNQGFVVNEGSSRSVARGTRVFEHKKRKKKSKKKTIALVASVVIIDIKTMNTPRTGRQYFDYLLRLKCSAEALGIDFVYHLIYGGGFTRHQLQSLRTFGWRISDHSADMEALKRIFHPLYSKVQATKERRMYIAPTKGHLDPRVDGWATYLKFFAWNLLQYDLVLHVDAEVHFVPQHDPLDQHSGAGFVAQHQIINFLSSAPPDFEFWASREDNLELHSQRAYPGINSHMMLFKPSASAFAELVARAARGFYIVCT